MTTTHTQPSAHQRHHSRQQQHSNYAVVWGLIVTAMVAAVAYGYYTTERAASVPQEMNATQAYAPASPTADSTSSMVGQPSAEGLTPSTRAPGTPDTTTTESSAVPAQGMR